MSIPKIIHLVEPAHNVLSVWQNTHPDWQCIEWSIEGCYAFLKRYYPTAEEAYLRLATPQQRIHFSWYYLLHRYGGVVIEGGRVPRKKIEGLFLSLYDLYLIEDWFIASVPQTEFLESAIATLPTLEPKWYDRFTGTLVRSTATIIPDTPYKRHPERVYQNYFHPLQHLGLNKVKIVLIVVLLFIAFHLIKIVSNKDKLHLWKLRWRILFPKRARAIPFDSFHTTSSFDSGQAASSFESGQAASSFESGQAASSFESGQAASSFESGQAASSFESGQAASPFGSGQAASPFESGQAASPFGSISVANLEKGLMPSLGMPYIPFIKIPPLDPPTPSSISFSPASELTITPFSELEITI